MKIKEIKKRISYIEDVLNKWNEWNIDRGYLEEDTNMVLNECEDLLNHIRTELINLTKRID